MGGLKISISPLFFLFGIYYGITGRVLIFITYTICALLHELGHSYAAGNCGYKLNKIKLMPFGAVASGNIEELRSVDEFKIAIAGPLVNFLTAMLFIAIWWIIPEVYAFTDIAVEASLSLAIINCLPVFPLDGGRVLCSIIAKRKDKKFAVKVCKILGIVLSLIMFALFILTCFYQINLSLLFFSAFVFFGAIEKEDDKSYVRLFEGVTTDRLKRGIAYKKIGVDKSVPIKKVMNMLDYNLINQVTVFESGIEKREFSQEELLKILKTGDLYSPIGEYI